MMTATRPTPLLKFLAGLALSLSAGVAHAEPLSSLGISGQVLFVTEDTFVVEAPEIIPPQADSFGSVLAADYHITSILAQNGLLDEPWDLISIHGKALLTAYGQGIVERAGLLDVPFYNVHGELIAPDLANLIAGNFSNPILTASGQQLLGTVEVWTGSDENGEQAMWNVDNWSDPFLGWIGAIGELNGTGTEWLSATNLGGNSFAHLYGVVYVPEPSSLALAVMGLLGMGLFVRRRREK